MARFDVFANPSGTGFLLDVQTDLLNDLNTRVVVPLLPAAHAPEPAARLNPTFDIAGQGVVMVTQFMAAVPHGILGPRVGTLDKDHDQITLALDMLLQGF